MMRGVILYLHLNYFAKPSNSIIKDGIYPRAVIESSECCLAASKFLLHIHRLLPCCLATRSHLPVRPWHVSYLLTFFTRALCFAKTLYALRESFFAPTYLWSSATKANTSTTVKHIDTLRNKEPSRRIMAPLSSVPSVFNMFSPRYKE